MDKAARLGRCAVHLLISLLAVSLLGPAVFAAQLPPPKTAQGAPAKPGDYMGSEMCMACHPSEAEQFKKTSMAVLLSEKYPVEKRGCEACHGPGRAHAEGEMAGKANATQYIYNFTSHTARENADRCLTCHQKDQARSLFHRSRHLGAGVTCIDCHDPHLLPQASKTKPGAALQTFFSVPQRAPEQEWLNHHLLRQNQPMLCYSCHKDIESQFQLPVRHRVNEGMVKCTDCHNPHGTLNGRELRWASEEACETCHVEKRGPFVYEHASVRIEGCTACHTPHGSINLHLLKRRQERQLCLECHVAPEAVNVPHPRLGFQAAGECTRCHVAIHGSNYQPQFLR